MANFNVSHRGCPSCYTNRKGRTNRKGHQGYRKPVVALVTQQWEISAMRRPTSPPNGSSGQVEPGQLLEGLVNLFDFLTDATWDDGKPRQLGTVTVFTQDGRWKVSLNDRDEERFAILTGTSVEECLELADARLGADQVEWRESTGARRRRK